MSNEIQIFKSEEFGEIRTLTVDGQPWFVGKDVAEMLGYKNSRKAIADHVDEEDKTDGVTIRDSIGREQNPIIINESGLYALIIGSKLDKAKQFKRWVTSEVLPTIRKTGGYVANEDMFSANYLDGATDEVKKLFQNNLEIIRGLKNQLDTQNATIQKLEGIVSDRSRTYKRNITVAEMCNLIGQYGYRVTQKQFMHWMREYHYIGSEKYRYDYNKPSEKSIKEDFIRLEYYEENGKHKTKLWLTPNFQKKVLEGHLKMALAMPDISFVQIR